MSYAAEKKKKPIVWRQQVHSGCPYHVVYLNTYRLSNWDSLLFLCQQWYNDVREVACTFLSESQGHIQPTAQLRAVLQIPKFVLLMQSL